MSEPTSREYTERERPPTQDGPTLIWQSLAKTWGIALYDRERDEWRDEKGSRRLVEYWAPLPKSPVTRA